MTTAFNPFPDYPVVRLIDDAASLNRSTVVTDAIGRSRKFVQDFVDLWTRPDGPTDRVAGAVIVGVRGDDGTGKTHLLLDAIGQLRLGLASRYEPITTVRVATLEADPVTWYRAVIGPAIKGLPLSSILTALYARAGAIVAGETKLTQPAVQRLQEKPNEIYKLVREDMLGATAVEQRFASLLNEICADVCEPVRAAFKGLVWAETSSSAEKWIAGESIAPDELGRLHISGTFADAEAAGVVVGLAAIHRYLNRPFCLFVDELEHFARFDTASGGKANVTWLKRLLEGLGNNGALVFVSGHWSAWEAHSDYLDRFSHMRPLQPYASDATILSRTVAVRVPGISPPRFKDAAEAIATCTQGNMRRTLSLCNALFRDD